MVVAVGLTVEDDLLAFRVDVGHLSEKHLNIALFADQLSQGVAMSPRETSPVDT